MDANGGLCVICNEVFVDGQGLQEHFIKHSNDSFTVIPLKLHVGTTSLAEFLPVNAQNLNNETNNIFQVKKHYNSTLQHAHACSICGKEFKRKDHLKKHSFVHSGIKPFTCLICCKSFSRKDRLKEHSVTHQSNGWSCYFCGKIFAQRCILRSHEMIHRGVKPFGCEICNTFFSRKNDLLRHMASHSGEKKHFCEVCGKGFTQKRLVQRHLLVHKKESLKNIKTM